MLEVAEVEPRLVEEEIPTPDAETRPPAATSSDRLQEFDVTSERKSVKVPVSGSSENAVA